MLGIGTLAKKVFGTPNDRKIKATRPLVEKINALEEEFLALTDDGLKQKTEELRKRAIDGESLDDLLPEAFANCREGARRTLGLRAFDTQLMSAIFLHQGNISEQKTGEGKTLTATLAAYLNALTGKGVHVVVPLTPGHDWEAHKDFSRRFAEALSMAEPDRFTATMSKAKRKGRIFIDWLRNQRGATAVVPYSARARSGVVRR